MDEFQNKGQVGFEDGLSASDAGKTIADTLAMERPDVRLVDRLRQIHEHRAGPHDNPNTLTAVLRNVDTDLMEIEAYVAKAIRDAVTVTPMTAENINEYSASIDLVIRLAKQIAQMTQLEFVHRSTKGREVDERRSRRFCAPFHIQTKISQLFSGWSGRPERNANRRTEQVGRRAASAIRCEHNCGLSNSLFALPAVADKPDQTNGDQRQAARLGNNDLLADIQSIQIVAWQKTECRGCVHRDWTSSKPQDGARRYQGQREPDRR